eukprot:CAMPEP_0198736520 /NCGR_PEP_ID=MMETSP1475-20131203/66269_1 /TAXON_ID= ORGANISM="Unidentified sp., Strain CCMP1999" /NCGR_SAMPLE_ID=MMETSP1475 /ASSEMBLY_ACC=CAM_ASM_001111 /LENGTH=359 /DNA_ID=CAMNT_0044500341 /DNA_START=656 /DNA_END=1732 /DNA_ORIENTATION=-
MAGYFGQLVLAWLFVGAVTAARPKCEEELPKCIVNLKNGKSCETLPIPDSSLPPRIRDVGYNLRRLRPGVFTAHDGIYFMLIIKTKERLVVVDSPLGGFQKVDNKTGKVGTRVIDAVKEVVGNTKPRVIDMIHSHEHADHVGSSRLLADYLRQTYPSRILRIWGAEGFHEAIEENLSDRVESPTELVKEEATLDLRRGLQVKMVHVPGAHTSTDMIVYVPRFKEQPSVLFFVDVIFPGWSPPFALALSPNAYDFRAVHDRVLDFQIDIFVGGHLTRTGKRSDVVRSKNFAQDVLDTARRVWFEQGQLSAIGEVAIGDPESREFGNGLLVLKKSFANMRKACAIELIERWGCKLAAMDLW